MSHQIDTVHWFTGLKHPRSVVANGGIYVWKDGRKNWDTMTAVFDYGPPMILQQVSRLRLHHVCIMATKIRQKYIIPMGVN